MTRSSPYCRTGGVAALLVTPASGRRRGDVGAACGDGAAGEATEPLRPRPSAGEEGFRGEEGAEKAPCHCALPAP